MRRLLPFLFLVLCIALWMGGCSEDVECSGDLDCPGDKICRSNRCVTPEPAEGEGETCREDTDCDPPKVCDKTVGRCKPPEQYDAGGEGEGEGEERDAGPSDDGGGGADVVDNDQPEVVRTVPEANTRGVAVDAPILVVFSEPVKEQIVTAPAILLFSTMDPEGLEVNGPVKWDEDTLTATLTPVEPLLPYTTYKLVVKEEIKDLHNNVLVECPDIFFTTDVDQAAEAHYEAISRRYAPHVYQETNSTMVQADWLAAYDFDGGWEGENKFRSWQRKKDLLAGALYWNVTETKTHYFITYAHYHPFDYDQSGIEHRLRDNGMAGAQVVVAKHGGPAQEEWLAVETYVGRDQIWSFSVEGKAIQARPAGDGGIGQFTRVMAPDWLLNDKHYQAFIPYGTHESCVWGHSTGIGVLQCIQPIAMAFNRHSGLHYLPGEGAAGDIPLEDLTECQGGCPAGETCINGECSGFRYGLRSLAAELWVRRHQFSEAGESIWDVTFTYHPEPEDQNRPGKGMVLPGEFVGAAAASGASQPPWAWDDRDDSEVARGQWFLDPAYTLNRHLQPEGAWSTSKREHCWNIYLGIFGWKDPGCSGYEGE